MNRRKFLHASGAGLSSLFLVPGSEAATTLAVAQRKNKKGLHLRNRHLQPGALLGCRYHYQELHGDQL